MAVVFGATWRGPRLWGLGGAPSPVAYGWGGIRDTLEGVCAVRCDAYQVAGDDVGMGRRWLTRQ